MRFVYIVPLLLIIVEFLVNNILEVTILVLLYKGNSGDLSFYIYSIFGGFSSFGIYNTSVKLQIIVKGELFPLLS